jgi:hypothetical protein
VKLSLRTRVTLVLLLLVAGAGGVLALLHHQQRLEHDRRVADCEGLKQQLLSYRATVLTPGLARMHQLRLNDLQARTLRQDDPSGYLRYAARYEESVNSVAQSVEAFGGLLDRFQHPNCIKLVR